MPSPTLSPVINIGIAGLEAAINAAIDLDPAIKEKLTSFQGKSIALACTEPNIVLTMVLGEHIQVLQSVELDDPMIDASLSGSTSAWFALIRAEDQAAELINGDLQLKGDSRLFQDLGSLAQNIDIDWETWLAERIGDVPTHLASTTIKRSVELGKSARTSIDAWIKDTLNSELSPVANKTQSDALYQELRNLEMRIDRLDAKIKRLND